MSKSQQWVCFNDTYHQCNDSSTLIILPISESIRLLVHVQLVSLLQWHNNVFNNKQIFELVSISKLSVSLLQWHHQCNDLLIALPISELIRLSVHMQLVSLLQWHLFSMQWSTRSHRSTHQWTWSYVHVQLVSLLQWRAQSQSLQWASRSVSLLQWHCQCNDLFALIILLISESIRLLVHVQLVSLLQWHFVNAMIYLLIILPISELICWLVHMQLVSLLQWHFYLA